MSNATEVAVVAREDIPAIYSIIEGGKEYFLGEHRDFRRHDALKHFIPEFGRLSLSWAILEKGKTLAPHEHPTESMIIICNGEGELIGQKQQPLKKGDIVMIPPFCQHGFFGGGDNGMECLSIQFEDRGLYENTANPRVVFSDHAVTYEDVLQYSKERLHRIKQTPCFMMMKNKEPLSHEQKLKFLDCLQLFSNHFQHMMFVRQATCLDPRYRHVFTEHLQEEFGHDLLLEQRDNKTELKDPVLDATLGWFTHQMYIRDNVEKAVIVHMVVESPADEFHGLAHAMLADLIRSNFFERHEEADDNHSNMADQLLQDQHPMVYPRIKALLEEAWDMLETVLNRIHWLIHN